MKTLLTLNAIVICLIFSQSTMLQAQSNSLFFVPQIKYDKATLSGKIDAVVSGDKGLTSISLTFTKVVTTDKMEYEIPVKKDGTFSFSIPVECISIAGVKSDLFEGVICLIPGEETKLEISFDREQKKHVKLINSLGLTANDAMHIIEVITEAVTQTAKMGDEILTPEIYSQRVINKMQEIQKIIETNTQLSGVAKHRLNHS